MENKWVRIYSTGNPIHIDIIQNMLLDDNIKSVFVNKKDSSYLFGEIELNVQQSDVLKALQIVKHFLENEGIN